MGIGGHMLGPKKLKRLATLTGLPLDRAYIRNGYSEGRTPDDRHWEIDPKTGAYEEIIDPHHWTSCRDLPVNNPAAGQEQAS